MNKNRIRLTESQLHNVIKESVKKVLKEGVPTSSKYDQNIVSATRDSSLQGYDTLRAAIEDLKITQEQIRSKASGNTPSFDKYADYISKTIKRLEMIENRLKSMNIMDYGQQPEADYFDNF